MAKISFAPTIAGWQAAARDALARELPPERVEWHEEGAAQAPLPLGDAAPEPTPAPRARRARVPRRFVERARRVACHRDPGRWALLYRLLWRLTHGEPRLLDVPVDADVRRFEQMDQEVRREEHKMHAFVRFRPVLQDGEPWHVAWFEPEHHVVELAAGFFRDRFANQRWSILTPDRSVHWDGTRLHLGPGSERPAAPDGDDVEELWRRYYASIFNPARVKLRAMRSEMPQRYWRNLPEAAVIPSLVRDAPARVGKMLADSDAKSPPATAWQPAVPPATADLHTLRASAAACTACPLYATATQTVFGEGPANADVVLVGEQPGDQEDREGRPFVGPAGQLLDRALAEAGLERDRCWVTNTVKHFKWEPRGKRRIHQTPTSRDVAACRPWLDAELKVLRPRLVVLLGATAARAMLGPSVRVLRDRGVVRSSPLAPHAMVTVHPSALLRAPDEETARTEYARFVADLNVAARFVKDTASPSIGP